MGAVMRTTRWRAAAVAAVLGLLGACGDDGDTTATTTTSAAAGGATTVTAGGATTAAPVDQLPAEVVVIADFRFVRDTTTVSAGTTVTWENADAAGHTVTASDGSFDSGRLEPGDTFEHTFDEPGEYAYFCSIHPSMTAKVVVTG
jgi:plastocyanin